LVCRRISVKARFLSMMILCLEFLLRKRIRSGMLRNVWWASHL
jgi:hypothetical protein